MSKLRVAVATGFAATALLLMPVGGASAHVHRVTPLNCTPASDEAGADVAFEVAADEAGLVGVIPITKGGEVTDGGSDAAVCDDTATEADTAEDTTAN
jgi:hypothetical protein